MYKVLDGLIKWRETNSFAIRHVWVWTQVVSVSFANDHADKGGSICLCEDVLISRAPRLEEWGWVKMSLHSCHWRSKHYMDTTITNKKSVIKKNRYYRYQWQPCLSKTELEGTEVGLQKSSCPKRRKFTLFGNLKLLKILTLVSLSKISDCGILQSGTQTMPF